MSAQLATEHEAMRRVLSLYQEGCHRILASISEAQASRMQEMMATKSRVCQDISQGLQELNRRVHEMQEQ